MDAPELPEMEQPEADVPEAGAPPSPHTQSAENPGEAAEELYAAAETTSAEAALPGEAVDMPLPAPSLDEMSASSFAAAEPEASADSALPTEAAPSPEGVWPAPRTQLAIVAAGLLLIGLGIMLIWPALSGGLILVPGLIVLITSLGVTLTLLAYWRQNARRARGALFLSLLSLTWGPLTSILLLAPEIGGLARLWPFYVIGLGLAALLTAPNERPFDARAVATGLVAIAGGSAALAVTWDLIQADALATAREAGPWLLVILAVGLLPLVIRRARSAGSSDASS